MASRFSLIVITLWVGALWMTGLSAYVLFDTLQNKHLAGSLAGKLFTIVGYIGMASGCYLLLQCLLAYGTSTIKKSLFWVVLLMLLLVLAGHFGIQPLLAQLRTAALPDTVMNSVFASRFSTWHGVASVAYLLECLLGVALVLKGSQ